MKIVFTRTFEKELDKIGPIGKSDILHEIEKYTRGLSNLIELYSYEDGKVLKGYFLSKKVRVCIWFREVHVQFIPFFIARKETKSGYNITKSDREQHELILDRHISDIENGAFHILEF